MTIDICGYVGWMPHAPHTFTDEIPETGETRTLYCEGFPYWEADHG
jgi:hypothetical protein